MDIANEVPRPEPIVQCQALLGEGPVWDARDAALYWVDVKGPAIFRRAWADGAVERWVPPFRVSSLAPRRAGGFIAGTEHGFAIVDPAAGRYELIGDPEPHFPANRFNDGKTDAHGQFWAGTMDDREEEATGSLYRLDPAMTWTCHDEGYRVTNGPAFSPDGQTLYHSDSALQTIYAFTLDAAGVPGARRVFAQFGEGDGYPDGMTVDRDGFLWVAFWDGWCLRRLSPEGKCVAELKMPVQRPTSCTFGGPDLDHLFITSARIGLDESALLMQPLAGALFMTRMPVGGRPTPLFAG